MKKLNPASWLVFASIALALSGCGWFEGSDSNDNSGAAAAATTPKTVSGVVKEDTAPAEGASVTINTYNTAGDRVDSATATSNRAGSFSASVKMPDSGGFVIVAADKDGFTSSSTKFDFAAPADLNAVAEITPVVSITATATSDGTFSGAPGLKEPAFVFGVVRYPDGTRKALSGDSLVAAKAGARAIGATTELQVAIPVSSVPPETTSLTGEFRSFDPTNPDDEKHFPGEYKDAAGNRLVSLGFDYMNIKDTATGENLGKSVARARAAGLMRAATAPTVITRSITSSNCDSILRDEDTAAAGYQISVWVYNYDKGYWDFVGKGTVVDAAGAVADPFVLDSCRNGAYDLRIDVTNEYFVSRHWNLDQAVLGETKSVCVAGIVRDEAGNPISALALSLKDDRSDSKQSFGVVRNLQTDANGRYSITTLLNDSTDTDRTAALTYYNMVTFSQSTASVTLADAPACGTADITVTAPKMCAVEGRLVDAGSQALPGKDVWLIGDDTYFFEWATTDAAGKFATQAICGVEVSLFGGSWFSSVARFNANGTTGDHPDVESTDDGSKVVLKDIVVSVAEPGVLALDSGTYTDAAASADTYPDFFGFFYMSDSVSTVSLWFYDDDCTAGAPGCFADTFSLSAWNYASAAGVQTYLVGCVTAENLMTGTWITASYEPAGESVSYEAGCESGTLVGSGSVTVSEITDLRVKGTLALTLVEVDADGVPVAGGGSKVLNGSFDVPRYNPGTSAPESTRTGNRGRR